MKKVTKAQLSQGCKASREIISVWAKDRRMIEGLTQGELADICGIDRKTVNRIEKGHFSPSIDTLTRIAISLNVKLPVLV